MYYPKTKSQNSSCKNFLHKNRILFNPPGTFYRIKYPFSMEVLFHKSGGSLYILQVALESQSRAHNKDVAEWRIKNCTTVDNSHQSIIRSTLYRAANKRGDHQKSNFGFISIENCFLLSMVFDHLLIVSSCGRTAILK